MSEYTFGDYDPTDDTSGLGESEQAQGPKWFREGLDKLSSQVKELRAENEALKAAKVEEQVAKTLKAKGYDPAAATLFKESPDKLDDWLGTYGAALAKLPGEGQEQGEQQPAGPPVSTVPADGQEQMQRMSEAGTQGVSAPQGSEAELVQRLKNASPEEFAQLMRAQGNTHDWS